MSVVFRIAKSQYIKDKSGEGSFKYGGRWVPEGYRVLYASESRALAFCECMANLGFSQRPSELALMEIEIPANIKVKTIQVKDLSKNWKKPSANECREIGKEWLMEGKFAILKVPSVIIQAEFNFVINVGHPDFKTIGFARSQNFFPDDRFLQGLRK